LASVRAASEGDVVHHAELSFGPIIALGRHARRLRQMVGTPGSGGGKSVMPSMTPTPLPNRAGA
jgi:hypothetical protein